MELKKYTFFNKIVWDTFVQPGEVVEVRMLKASGWAKSVVSGYFDDHDAFCKAVKQAD